MSEILDQCEYCGHYELSPAPMGLCADCAMRHSRDRERVEARGGAVFFLRGERIEITAEELETSIGAAKYVCYARAAALYEPRPVRYAGGA